MSVWKISKAAPTENTAKGKAFAEDCAWGVLP